MTPKDIAKHVFARNPKCQELYVTADNRGFFEEHHADAHAQRLKDRTVLKIERKDLKQTDVTNSGGSDVISDTSAASGGAPIIKGKEGLQVAGKEGDTELKDLGFDELKALATKEGVDLESIPGNLSKKKIREAIENKRKEFPNTSPAENPEGGAPDETGGEGGQGANTDPVNFEDMDVEALVAHAKETFDLDLNPEAEKETLIGLLNDHINALDVDEEE